MALTKEKLTPSLLVLSCNAMNDFEWARQLIAKLRDNGWKNVLTTYEFPPGSEYFSMIDEYIRAADILLIILSQSSEQEKTFMKTVNCSIKTILDNDLACRVIPVALHPKSTIPFALQDVEVFRAWQEQDDSKLIRALLETPGEQVLTKFISTLVSLNVNEEKVRRLNKISLPSNLCTDISNIGKNILKHWGVRLRGNLLIVDMLKLQNNASYNRICLFDLFSSFFGTESSNICFVRLYNVKRFNFHNLFQNGQVYGDLEGIYHTIMTDAIPSFQHFWYQYRRNGLCPTDNAELAFKPVVQAKFAWHKDEIHSPQYEKYEERMKTLENFVVDNFLVKHALAISGFFGVGVLDFVQCYYCGSCIRILNLKYHEGFYFGKCPLNDMKMSVMKSVCENTVMLKKLGLATFETRKERKDSFKPLLENVQSYDINLLDRFVDAGFFYRGTREDTICYACDLSLTNIKDYTNPELIHKTFSPDCSHMRTVEVKNPESGLLNKNVHPYLELEILCRNENMFPELNNNTATVDDDTQSYFYED